MCALSALLFAAAQPPWSLAPLAYVALVPWLVLAGRTNAAGGALSGLFVGSLAGLLVGGWIPESVEAMGGAQPAGVLVLATAAFLVLGLPFAAVGAATALLRRAPVGGRIVGVALAVFLADAARSVLPGAAPWALLGHSQWSVAGVAQLAAVGGVPLVSGAVALVNAALAVLLVSGERAARRRSVVWLGAAAGGTAACALAALPLAQELRERSTAEHREDDVRPLEILAVQPRLPEDALWAPSVQRTHLALLEEQVRRERKRHTEAPDLIVLPETVLTRPVDRGDALAAELLSTPERLGAPLLLGAARSSGSRGGARTYRSSALWLEPQGGGRDALDKVRAVPWVEALPAGGGLLGDLARSAAPGPRVLEGAVERPLGRAPSLAVVLCYEAIYPAAVARRRASDTAAIVQLSNEVWAPGGALPAQQLAYASFRAIEQRLPLLRVVLGGGSAHVDRYGRVVKALGESAPASLHARVEPGRPPLARTNFSLIVLYGAGAAGGAAAGARLRLPRREPHASPGSSPVSSLRATPHGEVRARG